MRAGGRDLARHVTAYCWSIRHLRGVVKRGPVLPTIDVGKTAHKQRCGKTECQRTDVDGFANDSSR
jgi:hypothetical protein